MFGFSMTTAAQCRGPGTLLARLSTGVHFRSHALISLLHRARQAKLPAFSKSGSGCLTRTTWLPSPQSGGELGVRGIASSCINSRNSSLDEAFGDKWHIQLSAYPSPLEGLSSLQPFPRWGEGNRT